MQDDVRVQLAVLQSIVQQGFTGLNERLDKLNGRVYTGEAERSLLKERVAVLEALREEESEHEPPPPPPDTSNTKVAAIATGAAGTVWGVVEGIKAILPYFQHGP